jgi:hypothetical protein
MNASIQIRFIIHNRLIILHRTLDNQNSATTLTTEFCMTIMAENIVHQNYMIGVTYVMAIMNTVKFWRIFFVQIL